jgi:hypothetical protein
MPFVAYLRRYTNIAADHRSFHQAACALEVEQSTLSRSILHLERRTGNTDSRASVRDQAGI